MLDGSRFIIDGLSLTDKEEDAATSICGFCCKDAGASILLSCCTPLSNRAALCRLICCNCSFLCKLDDDSTSFRSYELPPFVETSSLEDEVEGCIFVVDVIAAVPLIALMPAMVAYKKAPPPLHMIRSGQSKYGPPLSMITPPKKLPMIGPAPP